jgi:hypothetical protein
MKNLKRPLLNLIALLFLSQLVTAQNKCCLSKKNETKIIDKKISFDFIKRNQITIPNKIKVGEFYQVEVKNINQNLYNIEINNEAIDLQSTALSTSFFTSIDLGKLSSYLSPFLSPFYETKNEDDVTTVANSAAVMDKKNNQLDLIDFKVLTANFEKFTANPVKTDIEKTLDENTKYQQDLAVVLFASNRILDSLQFSVLEARFNLLAPFETETNLSTKPSKKKNKKVNVDAKNDDDNSNKDEEDPETDPKPNSETQSKVNIDYKSFLKTYIDLRKQITLVNKNVDKFQKAYNEFLKKPKVVEFLKPVANKKLKDKSVKVTATYSELKSKTMQFQEATKTEGISKLLFPIILLKTDKNFTSLPIQFTKDQEKLEISFVPKDSTSGLQKETLSAIYFPAKSNVYWSVGTSLYHSQLNDQRVGINTVKVNDSTTSFQLFEEQQLDGELGVAALLRAGTKLNNNSLIGIHGTFGTGLSIGKDVRPRFLIGGGLSIGKKHNVVIDYGKIAGYVDELSNSVDYNKTYSSAPQPLITQLKWDTFFSLGYSYIF